MARLWWQSIAAFEGDLRGATDSQLQAMHAWAVEKERSADAPGMGRNPKARRMANAMRRAAVAELERRGMAD